MFISEAKINMTVLVVLTFHCEKRLKEKNLDHLYGNQSTL